MNVNLDALQTEYDGLKATHTELAGQLATVKEELQPMKDIRYWIGKVLTPEQAEVEKKPEPKHSLTEKMKFLQEQDKKQPGRNLRSTNRKNRIWNSNRHLPFSLTKMSSAFFEDDAMNVFEAVKAMLPPDRRQRCTASMSTATAWQSALSTMTKIRA